MLQVLHAARILQLWVMNASNAKDVSAVSLFFLVSRSLVLCSHNLVGWRLDSGRFSGIFVHA
jgi:hypothetical protein